VATLQDFAEKFIWPIIQAGLGSAALIGIVTLAFQEPIRRFFEKGMLKDLERVKNENQRDLEAYKVSLIAEAERYKASQDVKKSGALRVVEKRFSALDALHRATLGNGSDFFTALTIRGSEQQHAEERMKLHTRIAELRAAMHASDIFLTREQRGLVRVYLGQLISISDACSRPVPQQDLLNQMQNAVLGAEIDVDNMLEREVTSMMTM
jgi:hypothetical protein